MKIDNCSGEIIKGEGHQDLREVYAAVQQYFPPDGNIPEPLMFTAPQYNTWIELMYDQEEEKILEYAEAIINNGMPPGILMIDDNWQEDYGVWQFHPKRFNNPKKMVERLHELGFKVMLWTCPFVSPDSATYRYLAKKGLLIKNKEGSPAIREWWNGYSAILDLTNPDTIAWYKEQLDTLMNEYGIDGFKFDAGDSVYYRNDDQCAESIHANEHAEYFARLGLQYSLNEFRACWKMAGKAIGQRLCDKAHSWDEGGLGSLIPNGLAQGLMGYAFTCPDMIGGGEYQNFLANSKNLDQELFVRYAQCSALFPMMQFSAAPWRVLDQEHSQYCLEAANLHHQFGEEILALANHAAETGEPIIRHMEYSFPNQGLTNIKDQFMLGNDILVAPVVKKGMIKRLIHFPVGLWKGDDGSVVEGPCEKEVDAPLSRLPWYRKIS
ncbi:glycoside hydrolase family 31 protein [Lederbergia wuyishanensis]|uniref:Alpha-glucosidase (Family GH31 glycosyl hydrolase) n=1 Tax=Lederbergia wuyishanensis TaxID=1347903 RepID=A0ABU0D5J7_9BACI|nr:glycoside hydrolase family 31 protein [Lederbergia wuyishanensis]MCJ8009829.1 glycoside hydrolase family 31 protein [Lederbergia wuyishanensis]MDQ0343686.1 alpha-glucosidase (family GH31 glycosyl hydrolase) [Lederbergia wuyishanensis]